MINKVKKIVVLTTIIVLFLLIRLNNETFNSKEMDDYEPIRTTDEEFYLIQGVWEIVFFIGKGLGSHSEEYTNMMESTDWDKYRIEKEGLIGKTFTITDDNLIYFLPDGVSGYDVDSYEDMFFGYKPPITLEIEYPVKRAYVQLIDYEDPIQFILDNNNKGIIDIRGDFYNARKLMDSP